jgi:hypothetical protein
MGDEGLVAELPSPRALVRAAEAAWAVGLTRIEAFSPYPVHDLPPPLMARPRRLTRAVGLMAVVGGAMGYFVQWLTTAWLYPLNVGGRPPHSWLAFVPITFESAVLAAALTAFVGMLVGAGLPRLSRPLFDVEGFERASHDRFFLWVSADDPRLDPRRTAELLLRSGALRVASVARGVIEP